MAINFTRKKKEMKSCSSCQSEFVVDEITAYKGKDYCNDCLKAEKDKAKQAKKVADESAEGMDGEETAKSPRKKAQVALPPAEPKIIQVQPVVNLAVSPAEFQKDMEQVKGVIQAFNEQFKAIREESAVLRERVAQQETTAKALPESGRNDGALAGALAKVEAEQSLRQNAEKRVEEMGGVIDESQKSVNELSQQLAATREEIARLQERDQMQLEIPILPDWIKNRVTTWAKEQDPEDYRKKLPNQEGILNRATGNFKGKQVKSKRTSFLTNSMDVVNIWWDIEGKEMARKRNEDAKKAKIVN